MTYRVTPALTAVVTRFAEGNMTNQVSIVRGALGIYDPSTGQSAGVANAVVIYTGKARVHPVAGFGPLEVGGGIVDERQATISIPMSATVPNRDDLVEVLDGAGDNDLDNEFWRVVQVEGGGLFNEARRMFCQSWHPSRYWGQQ